MRDDRNDQERYERGRPCFPFLFSLHHHSIIILLGSCGLRRRFTLLNLLRLSLAGATNQARLAES